MGWRMDKDGAALWEPLSFDDLQGRDEELAWCNLNNRPWKLVNGLIAASGDPTALQGGFSGLTAQPPAQAAPSVASVATSTPGVALWTTALYSPIPANVGQAPQAFHVRASGTVQTSTTSLTATMLPFIGTVVEAAAPSTFKTLGPSGALTLAATALTCLFELQLDVDTQLVGTAGTAVGYGKMHFTTAAAPATSAQTSQGMFGGTQATALDFTGTTAGFPGGIGMASWNSAGTVTWVPQIITCTSWN